MKNKKFMINRKEEFYSQKFVKNLILNNRFNMVLSILKGYHFNRLPDIGCGDGSFSLLLKNFSDEIYGVDIAKEAVESARKKGIKAYRVDLDKEDLPFEDNYFDGVFCGEVIEHLYDTDNLLNNIYRVLTPNGLCVITIPNISFWLNRIVFLLGFQPYLTEVSLKYNVGKFKANTNKISGHIRAFTYKSIKELLRLHGLSVKKEVGVDIAKELPFPINFLEKILSKKPSLALYLILVIEGKKDEGMKSARAGFRANEK